MISTAVESILGILSVVAGLGIFLAMFYALAYPIILVFKCKMLHSNTERTAAHIMLGFSAFAIALPFLVAFYLSSIGESSAAGFGFAYALILAPFVSLLGLIIARKFKE